MALDQQKQKSLKKAERLLKQGKVQEAWAHLERVNVSGSGDLLTLNRLGDLLARQGCPEEAMQTYQKIAAEFTKGGFFPKAIAIHKKTLRLDKDHVGSLLELGELYLQQKLPGEGRGFLLHAAEILVREKNFADARAVYEKLVQAEPGDPRHRARLAEARAAEGDVENAGQELLLLAESLFTSGKPGDAEQTYRRCAELLPGDAEPLLGICRAVREQGREDEALQLLEQATSSGDGAPPALLGELVLYYEMAGRGDDALALLRRPEAHEVPADALSRLFRYHVDGGRADELWTRLDPVFTTWCEGGQAARVEALYGRLATLEDLGHIPALQRLYEHTRARDDRRATVHALEELVRAYRAQSMQDQASSLLEQLKELAPQSSLLGRPAAEPAPAEAPTEGPAPEPPPEAEDDAPAPATGDAVSLEAEAPAVPLNRNDEEFVAGRLTQAEILEKYGLLDQSMQQVREVVAKFPGHVPAQERMVTLLRNTPERGEFRDALVGLALARRAVGDLESARQAAREAVEILEPDDATREMLERLALVETREAAAPAPAEPAAQPGDTEPAPLPVAAAPGEPADSSVVIDFDDDEGEEAVAEPPAVEPPAAQVEPPPPTAPSTPSVAPLPPVRRKPVRAPGADMLDEIRFFVDQGMFDDARQRVASLRALGYASEDLDGLAEQIEQAASVPPAPPVEAEPPAPPPATEAPPPQEVPIAEAEQPPVPVTDAGEDDDLSTLTAALESELFDEEEVSAPAPEAQSEQSLGDVFAAFRQHVAEEVGSDDFRTRYDLGIAYKEMGLMDEAIEEFRIAVKAPEGAREAAIMLAMCHRDRQEQDLSAEWYRKAIELPGGDAAARNGLRYELAEVLLESGDDDGALGLFREVHAADPAFRDVGERVAQLEARLTP